MLVVNKLAVAAIPLPTVVSGAQLVSSAIVPLLMQLCGYSVIGKMTYARSLPYVVYTSMFAAGLFANMKALAADKRRGGDCGEVLFASDCFSD